MNIAWLTTKRSSEDTHAFASLEPAHYSHEASCTRNAGLKPDCHQESLSSLGWGRGNTRNWWLGRCSLPTVKFRPLWSECSYHRKLQPAGGTETCQRTQPVLVPRRGQKRTVEWRVWVNQSGLQKHLKLLLCGGCSGLEKQLGVAGEFWWAGAAVLLESSEKAAGFLHGRIIMGAKPKRKCLSATITL